MAVILLEFGKDLSRQRGAIPFELLTREKVKVKWVRLNRCNRLFLIQNNDSIKIKLMYVGEQAIMIYS